MILRSADHQRAPWKNGLGVTYEVARSGEGDDFDWRLSFAEVEGAGPFSSFPGVDRVITLVAGEQIKLTLDGRDVQLLRPYEPFAFPGEAEVWSEAVGATVDLNVMTRRGRTSADVTCRRITGREDLDLQASFVIVLDGVLTLTDRAVELHARDVICDPPGVLAVVGDAVVATVRITAG